MAQNIFTGISEEGVQVIIPPGFGREYFELNVGYSENLPARRYVGYLFLAYEYDFGGYSQKAELRGNFYFSQLTGFLLTPQELATGRIIMCCNWRVPGLAWEAVTTDLPYP